MSSQSKIKRTLAVINFSFTCIPSFSFKISSHSTVFLLSASPNVCIPAFGYVSEAHFQNKFPSYLPFHQNSDLEGAIAFVSIFSLLLHLFFLCLREFSQKHTFCCLHHSCSMDPFHSAFGALMLWTATHHCCNNVY